MSDNKAAQKKYSDAAYVEGVSKRNPTMELALHKLCKDYFEKNFYKPEVGIEGKKDIFQSSVLALWENIRFNKIYARDGELKGWDGTPFSSTLTTYFMSIVNKKFLEWLRKNPKNLPIDIGRENIPDNFDEGEFISGFKFDDTDLKRRYLVAKRMNIITKQCNRILTLFYYEEKKYDEIMLLIPSFKSKDALKTAKYKCLKRLHDSVVGTQKK